MQLFAHKHILIALVISTKKDVNHVQVLLLGRDIDQKNIRDAILKVISNEQAMQVLECSMDLPKSAYELSTTCNIPLTQTYRWIRKLHRLGFVRISGATNRVGKKYFMYQSKVHQINIKLNTGSTSQIEIL